LREGLPQDDSNVFNRVMLVNVQIANAIKIEDDAGVSCEGFKHVIEKAYPRGNL
jgi:hypothetical protein